jgi:hypothetical protein
MKPIANEIETIRGELTELATHLPDWEVEAGNIHGAKKYRSIAKRIVLSAQRLEVLVKENTFSP